MIDEWFSSFGELCPREREAFDLKLIDFELAQVCQQTLPPILIALALSASSFNFFWLTWKAGAASEDVVVCSEDMIRCFDL